jgi:predicted nuclease of predicted toxin-antitoxin system
LPESWRLYLDECVEKSVLVAMEKAGIDAVSARSEKRLKESDATHLAHSAELGRTLVTYDTDFIRESAAFLGTGGHHHGILLALARQDVGTTIRNLRFSLDRWTPGEMRDQIRWLASST